MAPAPHSPWFSLWGIGRPGDSPPTPRKTFPLPSTLHLGHPPMMGHGSHESPVRSSPTPDLWALRCHTSREARRWLPYGTLLLLKCCENVHILNKTTRAPPTKASPMYPQLEVSAVPPQHCPADICDCGSLSCPSCAPCTPGSMTPCQDETLKQSFLTAVLMLVGAISRNEGAHSYEFSQISELLDCLMVSQGPRAEEGVSRDQQHPQEAGVVKGWGGGFLGCG